jgi:O-antigen/teichoic acid export membrane protein
MIQHGVANMDAVRVSLILMTGQRYFAMVVNFAMVAIVSRLLRPEEIGLAVTGTIVAVLATSVREFASMTFIVQKRELTPPDIHVAFSIMMVVTLMATLGLSLAARAIATAYEQPALEAFLYIVSIAIILEAAATPIMALMQRKMQFGKVALISACQVGISAVATVLLVLAGFSSMSYAWAWLAAAAASGLLAACLWRDYTIFRPSLAGWRDVLSFGGYSGASQILYRIYDSVPYMILGRFTSMGAVGIYNRAMTICQLPDKVFLSGIIAVALPAFSARARETNSLKAPYLRGVSYITAVMWPAQVTLAILAHPIVLVLLGPQWTAAVPVVQIMALAMVFAFSAELNYPVLIASGAIRATFTRALIIWPVSCVMLSAAAFGGPMAMALSLFLAIPFQAVVTIYAVRKCIDMGWSELFAAARPSLAVTLFAAAGPLVIVAWSGFSFALSIPTGVSAGALAAGGWIAGLWLTRHPLLGEIANSATLLRSALANR